MSGVPWEQDFDVYLTRLDESPISVVVDLDAASHAPVGTHPYLLRVRIVMKKPDENGLRSRNEFEALNALEDALLEGLAPALDAIHVGHMILRGVIDLVLYCPPGVVGQSWEIERLIEEIRGDYDVEPILQEDAEWHLYREIMFPDPYDLQFILNRRLLDLITRNGDDLASTRPVDHLALFRAEEEAEMASNELSAVGFTVDPPSLEETQSGEQVWAVPFHRAEALEGRAMDRVVAEILDVILPLGGSYDGWGCPTVKSASPQS